MKGRLVFSLPSLPIARFLGGIGGRSFFPSDSSLLI